MINDRKTDRKEGKDRKGWKEQKKRQKKYGKMTKKLKDTDTSGAGRNIYV